MVLQPACAKSSPATFPYGNGCRKSPAATPFRLLSAYWDDVSAKNQGGAGKKNKGEAGVQSGCFVFDTDTPCAGAASCNACCSMSTYMFEIRTSE